MKAAVVYGINDLRLEEIEKPQIERDDQILVKIKAVGICGSDIHILHGANPFATYPRIMGHEMVGEVEAVGDNVKNIAIGDHIVVEPITYCGKCYACRKGMPNVCQQLKVSGVHVDGGMREYIVIAEKQAHKIKKDIPWTTAVLAEPYTIAGNVTTRTNISTGDKVVIQGAGPIGITILRMAKVKGATVLVTDMVDEKLAFAKENGADMVVNPSKENLIETVKTWTDEEMANVVIDAACTPKTFEICFDLVSIAGTIGVLGMNEKPSNIPQIHFMKKQLTVVGSRLQAYQFAPVIRLMEAGYLNDDALVTHKFKFSDIKEAFKLIEENPEKVKKAVLIFE